MTMREEDSPLSLVYIYESQGANPDVREWRHGKATCANCRLEFMAVFHVPTYEKEGRLRCPQCLRCQALVQDQEPTNSSLGVH